MTVGTAFAAPSVILLNTTTVAENNANPTVIGTVSATCVGTCSYAMGTGGDTGSFSIVAGTGVLSITTVADFETKASYTLVEVVVTDSNDSATLAQTFTITVTNVVEAATDITGTLTVAENVTGAAGTLTAVGGVGTAGWSLETTGAVCTGTNGADNALFAIDASTGAVTTVAGINFETKPAPKICVQVSKGGEAYQEAFTVAVTNVNEAPTGITGFSASVAENTTAAGTLVAIDPDAGQTFTFTKPCATPGADDAKFTITGAALTFATAPNFEISTDIGADNVYNLCVRVADNGTPALTFDQNMAITVTNVNEMPTFTKGANITVAEDSGAYTLGTAWATVFDDGDSTVVQTLTFAATVPPADTAKFSVAPAISSTGFLTFTPALNANGVVTVSVTLTDDATITAPALTTAAQTFTITINAVNDAPTAITGFSATVAENTTAAGTLAATDVDTGQTYTFTKACGTPGADDAKFAINATTKALTFVTAPNFEDPTDIGLNNVYNLCVRVTDSGSPALIFDQAMVITVTDVNEAPTITFGGANPYVMSEDGAPTAFPGLPAQLVATDVDTGATLTWSVSSVASHGTATVSGTGANPAVFTYVPTANYNGTDSFTIQVTDGTNPVTKVINVSIGPVNDAPSFTKGADVTIACDLTSGVFSARASALSAGPVDEAAQTLAFTVVPSDLTKVTSSTLALNGDLTVNLAPAACTGAPHTVNLSITLKDNGGILYGGVDTSAAQIIVVNVAPVFSISGTIAQTGSFGMLGGGTVVKFDTAGTDYTGTVNPLTGAYTIAVPNGTVGLTPSLVPSHISGSGYTFVADGGNTASPITVTTALPTEDFTATGTRTISGTITGPNGARLPAGTVVNFGSGVTWTAPANSGGATTAFSITGLPPKNYLMTNTITSGAAPITNGKLPVVPGKLYPTVVFANTGFGDDTIGNVFTFGWTPYTISGTIKTPSGALPAGKVFSIKLDGTGAFVGQSITGTYAASTSTYTILAPFTKPLANNDPAAFTGTLVITGTGYQTFTPLISYTGATVVNNVTAYGDRAIFGDPAGMAIPDGVNISFGGGLNSDVEGGYFSLPYLERKVYTLTPVATGYFFTLNDKSFAQVKITANLVAGDVDLTNKLYAFAVPIQQLPVNGSTQNVGTTVTFTWDALVGAPLGTTYKVQYATNAAFTTDLVTSPATVAPAVTTTLTIVDNLIDKTYYWRVTPYNVTGTTAIGPASATQTFLR